MEKVFLGVSQIKLPSEVIVDMDKYLLSKKRVVDEQLVPRGIKDKKVLEAFMKVNRHNFVPDEYKKFAYDDRPIPIGYGQTISQPYMVAVMTEFLNLSGNYTLFEIGTGSGYQAAIASLLCKKVITFEYIKELSLFAFENITRECLKNVQIFYGDGLKLLKEYSPVSRLIISAAAPNLKDYISEVLGDDGIAVLPEGDIYSQILVKYSKIHGKLMKESFFGCRFVPLKGDYGL